MNNVNLTVNGLKFEVRQPSEGEWIEYLSRMETVTTLEPNGLTQSETKNEGTLEFFRKICIGDVPDIDLEEAEAVILAIGDVDMAEPVDLGEEIHWPVTYVGQSKPVTLRFRRMKLGERRRFKANSFKTLQGTRRVVQRSNPKVSLDLFHALALEEYDMPAAAKIVMARAVAAYGELQSEALVDPT